MENWHDFEIESRKEIVSLLRNIGQKNQLIRMLIQGESDVCVTSILAVDDQRDTVVLDTSIDTE
ncbi:flagellar brake protein, partial [Pseudomonas viridiflava]|uniref:flagellar brake protein n=1 Tax=Pseudomonas viridiflava TaxID=33069 RepID=UPI00197F3064